MAVPARAEVARAEVAATAEKGFGRLVLTFKDRMLPQYTTRLSGNVLVVQFAEPVQIDVDRLPTVLPAYVNTARRDPDGRALRFALTRQVKINTTEAGERLFLDLLPATWTGQPPGLPESVVADLARRAEEALKAQREAQKQRYGVKLVPKLDFRVGRHPTFTRLSFGWNVPFDTQMQRDAEKVTLSFNRLAEVDLTPVLVDPPAALRQIEVEPDGERMKIIMTLSPEADVRAFREDQTYVVDISGANKPSADHGPEAEIRKALESASGVPEGARGVVEAPGIQAPPTGDVPAVPAKPAAEAKAGGEAKAPVKPAPASKPAARPAPAKPSVAEAAPPPHAETPAPTAEKTAAAAPEAKARTDGAPPPVPAPAEGGEAPAQSGPERAETRDQGAASSRIVRVETKKIGNAVRVAFPFPSKTPSAAFKRDDSVWVVFDSTLPMDTRSIGAALGAAAKTVTVNRSEKGQTLRIRLAEPMLATMGADGNTWVLSIGEMVLEPARPLALRREVRGSGQGMLKIDLPDAGAVHDILDPEVGDRMYVVTALGPPRGLLKVYNLAEVDTLPSAHGVAVVPRTDDLSVSSEMGVVTITRQQGLNISTGSVDPARLLVPQTEARKPRRQIDASAFHARDPAEFTGSVRSMIEKIGSAEGPQKNQARYDLAEFYIAHRFAPEALGVLRLVAMEAPGSERDPGFIVLFGAAQAMTGRTAQAMRSLSRPEVADSADAALWRTIAAAGEQKWDEAQEASVKGAGALGAYPPDVQALFNLSAAEAAVELNDYNTAQTRLAAIEPDDVEKDLRARYEILQARVADAASRPEDAMERLDRAGATGDRRAQAEAEYRRLRMLSRDGKIPPEEAIDRLKSLAFDWRGDEIELKTLRFLSRLQADHGLYRDAFQNVRTASMVAPEASTTRLLQDEMNREFVSLYLDGKADRLQPLDALTIYYDYREMTPIGRLGDEIVRKLADRLVGVDLLDQAAELLTYQIDNRLRGAARAQIAADLAVIHLLNRKPDRAIAILNKTRQSQLPTSVERQRRVVEARALSESGRADVALELVGAMSGSDIDRLKADILWRNKRFGEAAERIELMLGGRWNEGSPLDDQERQDVLRSAVGYTLANDELGLSRLRGKYAAKMKDSPNAATFDVVTAPIQTQGGAFREVAREIAAVDTMRGFLQEYRTQYMKPAVDPAELKKERDAKPTGIDGETPKEQAPGAGAEAKPPAKEPAGDHGKEAAKPAPAEAKAKAAEPTKMASADGKPAAGH